MFPRLDAATPDDRDSGVVLSTHKPREPSCPPEPPSPLRGLSVGLCIVVSKNTNVVYDAYMPTLFDLNHNA